MHSIYDRRLPDLGGVVIFLSLLPLLNWRRKLGRVLEEPMLVGEERAKRVLAHVILTIWAELLSSLLRWVHFCHRRSPHRADPASRDIQNLDAAKSEPRLLFTPSVMCKWKSPWRYSVLLRLSVSIEIVVWECRVKGVRQPSICVFNGCQMHLADIQPCVFCTSPNPNLERKSITCPSTWEGSPPAFPHCQLGTRCYHGTHSDGIYLSGSMGGSKYPTDFPVNTRFRSWLSLGGGLPVAKCVDAFTSWQVGPTPPFVLGDVCCEALQCQCQSGKMDTMVTWSSLIVSRSSVPANCRRTANRFPLVSPPIDDEHQQTSDSSFHINCFPGDPTLE